MKILNCSSHSYVCLFYIIVLCSLVEDVNSFNVSFEVFGIANLCFILNAYILYDACIAYPMNIIFNTV